MKRIHVKLYTQRNETETKQFQNSFEIVMFQPKQNAKTAVKV